MKLRNSDYRIKEIFATIADGLFIKNMLVNTGCFTYLKRI